MARGEFDDLPGKGKPLPGLDRPHDEEWWVKEKLKREQLSCLPPALALRKEVEDGLRRVAGLPSEATVRDLVDSLNARIRHVNASITVGPGSTLMPLDAERVVANWRVRREHQQT